MAYEALDTLQQTLLQILKHDDDLATRRVKQQIISIHDKAVVFQLNLKYFPEKETIREVANTTQEIIQYLFSPESLSDCGSIEATDGLSEQLGELEVELESIAGDVVDYCERNGDSVNNVRQRSELIVRISNRLGRLAERIKSTAGELIDYSASNDSVDFDEDPSDSSSRSPLTSKDAVAGFVKDLSDSSAFSSSSRSAPTSKDVVVGFDEDIIEIVDRLTDYSFNLRILPIVGMGGIGKSTLAKLVYDHPLIIEHFDVRAWVTITQDYSIESILLNLLASVKGKVDQVGRDLLKGLEAEQLEIYQFLWGRRYLIVVDDMWSAEAWSHVQRLIPPDNKNGSWIILTTRLTDVATYATSCILSLPAFRMMRFLDEQQSWRLFQHKVFGDKDCPLELQAVGKKIVRDCGGLPLSIITVAGLLSTIDRTPKLWQQIGANNDHLDTIISLSYNHLPRHLRACFLYMAGLP